MRAVVSPCMTKQFGGLRKGVRDREVTDCRVKRWSAAGNELLIGPLASGDFIVMGAPSVAAATCELQAIGRGDKVGSERMMGQGSLAQ